MDYFNKTEVVSVIGDLNSKQNQITNLVDEVKTTKENLIEFSRQVLFPNHYGTNPLFLKGISNEDYTDTYVYRGE